MNVRAKKKKDNVKFDENDPEDTYGMENDQYVDVVPGQNRNP